VVIVSDCTLVFKTGGPGPGELNEISDFLAGKKIERDSRLFPITLDKRYLTYKKQIDLSWKGFQEKNLSSIKRWSEKNINYEYSKTVFYPFSGPDIINAVTFFPEAEKYILFGLEPAGYIPEISDMIKDDVFPALYGLQTVLSNALRSNFFLTKVMEKNISSNYLNSVIGTVMFFLGRCGCRIMNIKLVRLDPNGKVRYDQKGSDTDCSVKGCEIVFSMKRNGVEKKKKAYYFQLDVRNSSLRKHTNFIHFLKKQKRFATFIKAASYTMHNEVHSYTIIRSHILFRSDLILQDDSGIPLNFFHDDDWNLSFYGVYTRPVHLFENRYQPDLFNRIREYSKGGLPFSYGYYLEPESSHIMIAVRKFN